MKTRKHPAVRLGKTLVLVLLSVCLLAPSVTPAAAVTQADIDALKASSAALEVKKNKLAKELKALANDKAKVLERRRSLDSQIDTTSAQIQNMEAQIATYAKLITQTEEELAEAQRKEEEQYDLFCHRVRAMEEKGTVDYWSVLFHANSFSDLLSRLDIINEVMEYDQRVISQYQALQEEIAAKQAVLEDSKKESENARAGLVTKKKELDAQRQEAIALVKEIVNNESTYKATLNQLDQEEEANQRKIMRMSRELAAQQAAQSGGSSGSVPQANPGGYIWPVSSRLITSTFGGRASPGGIGSRNHKGIDIGRVGYTTPIHAAKAGTVIVSQYSNSYGHYVVVSHGGGNTTLYAHMSSRSVSVGKQVNQGDVLGITGSTGRSTGPHLHFEISEGGKRINPLKYLTGYTLSR